MVTILAFNQAVYTDFNQITYGDIYNLTHPINHHTHFR